uniref:glutathione peroxidase n=1 Tax=Naja naja TaxID=35670 RepID=A0A8C6XVZ9_NAJNA
MSLCLTSSVPSPLPKIRTLTFSKVLVAFLVSIKFLLMFFFCSRHVRPGGGYVPNFQLFQKGDVNGENEQKIYTFLKNSCPPVVETFGDTAKLFWSPLKIHDIKWNFEKFLVNPQGKPVMRWFHRTNVSTLYIGPLCHSIEVNLVYF